MRMLAIDPGLATCGFARIRIDNHQDFQVEKIGCILTTKGKSSETVSLGNVRRAREAARALLPEFAGVDVIAMESQSNPRSASAAAKITYTRGGIIWTAEAQGIPIVEADPQTVKSKLTGNPSATKRDVEAMILSLDSCALIRQSILDIGNKEHRSHPCDAIAIGMAAMATELVISMLRASKPRG